MKKKGKNSSLKIQAEQINFIVGDISGNCQKISAAYQRASKNNVDLVIFSELAVTGYPPEDLLLKDYFIKAAEEAIKTICKLTRQQKTAILLGCPASFTNKHGKKSLYNAAFFIEAGGITAIARKSNLPNYGIFDEKRYFNKAVTLTDLKFRDFQLAILLCEDIWDQKNSFLLASNGIDAILTLNASPFSKHKLNERINIAQRFIKDIKKPLIYVNQTGAQDSLVFDGGSFAIKENGEIALLMKEFQEDSAIIELQKNNQQITLSGLGNKPNISSIAQTEAKIYQAAILSISDYISKNGFNKVIIGLSGGIDSALVAAMATDALGSNQVKLTALPSRYNSQTSMNDALKLSSNLNIKLDIIPIEEAFTAINSTLSKQFTGTKTDISEENIQSRIRGLILMAISNKFNHLLLSTGNKSELAVGYATIYGDMCGGFNPIKDIYKTEIFKLAKWRNHNIPDISLYKQKNLIPSSIITKAPSAELRENQKDSDSLPEYEILDQILFNLIEEQRSVKELIKLGFKKEIVNKIAKLLYSSEYKRRQSVIGTKTSKMSFDKDWRYPITHSFYC